MKGDPKTSRKREPLIDPALEKPLLSLHRAMNVGSFWKATRQVLSAAMPNRVIGFTHNPILPLIAIWRWTQPMPQGFFAAEPLQSYVARRPRQKFVRISDLFPNRRSFIKSGFYQRCMAPQECANGGGLFFWKGQRLVCVIAILRTAAQGDLWPTEIELLRQLYPQFQTALRRLDSLEREHSVRRDFEECLSRLPLPTILLRWNLKLIYQNRAAREFCTVWEKGPEEAKWTNPTSPIPSEILDRCRLLKQQWARTRRTNTQQAGCEKEHVHHSGSSTLASDDSLEAVQIGWCSAAAFPYRVRRFAPSLCFGRRAGTPVCRI